MCVCVCVYTLYILYIYSIIEYILVTYCFSRLLIIKVETALHSSSQNILATELASYNYIRKHYSSSTDFII